MPVDHSGKSSLAKLGSSAINVLVLNRFPSPWSIDELEAYYVVVDSAGQKLAYVYFDLENLCAEFGYMRDLADASSPARRRRNSTIFISNS